MAHFELIEKVAPNAVIKVVGVGGGGGNAVAHMVNSSVDGVEFITANTDAQAIKNCGREAAAAARRQRHQGLGAGANPEVGRQAAGGPRHHHRRADRRRHGVHHRRHGWRHRYRRRAGGGALSPGRWAS